MWPKKLLRGLLWFAMMWLMWNKDDWKFAGKMVGTAVLIAVVLAIDFVLSIVGLFM